MPPKRVRYKNPEVATLLTEALRNADPPMSIEDLGRVTGWHRNAGAIVRGEVQRLSPEQVNELAARLPVTVEQILATYGYRVSRSTAAIYPPLGVFLGSLSQATQRNLLEILKGLGSIGGDQ